MFNRVKIALLLCVTLLIAAPVHASLERHPFVAEPLPSVQEPLANRDLPLKNRVGVFPVEIIIGVGYSPMQDLETHQVKWVPTVRCASGHLYYANLNPLAFVDPYGLCAESFGQRVNNALGNGMSSVVDWATGANGRFSEAAQNFRTGGQAPITVDPNTLNFSQLKSGDKNYTFPMASSPADFVVHGTVGLAPSQGGSQRVSDTFDFDVGGSAHPWAKQPTRNLETWVAHFIVDPLDAITDPTGSGTGSAGQSGNGRFDFNFPQPVSVQKPPSSSSYSGGSGYKPIK